MLRGECRLQRTRSIDCESFRRVLNWRMCLFEWVSVLVEVDSLACLEEMSAGALGIPKYCLKI